MKQSQLIWLAGLTLGGSIVNVGMPVQAQEAALTRLPLSQNLAPEDANPTMEMAQVNSVSSLRDVRPSDWAFGALQSLVERYGCIAGYPDQTFRGDRPLTRWEFAAGLNACLNAIERQTFAGGSELGINDINTLRRLITEFETELATLNARVDDLETRTTVLEDNQFSTTTKLGGEAIFSVSGATGGEPNSDDAQVTFNNRLRLNLTTSFTGKDALITGLQAYNFSAGSSITGTGSVAETLFPNDASLLGEGMTSLSWEPQFAGFNPQNLQTSCGNNSLCLYKLLYVTPVSDKLTAFIGPKAEVTDAFPTIIPFASEGQGAISRFATLNPVLRMSGGTSGTGLASAGGFIYQPNDVIDLRALYGSVNAAIPGNEGFPGTPLGAGLFNGSFIAATQLTIRPSDKLDLGLNYAYSYHQINIDGTGLTGTSGSTGATGVFGDLPLTTPIRFNSFGATVNWRVSPRVNLTGYGAYIMADQAGGGSAYTNLTSWMAGLYFPDALAKGNSAGILFGQPLHRVAAGNGASLSPANIGDRQTPYHLEAFYRYQINDHISITPGAFVIFNPEGDADNDTTSVFTLRTTYTF
ncbi:S-layer protein [[Limnothrix rosea] IAM M-220]|nr:S-layer protein [[Limnothrix rosea] IAM M-220]